MDPLLGFQLAEIVSDFNLILKLFALVMILGFVMNHLGKGPDRMRERNGQRPDFCLDKIVLNESLEKLFCGLSVETVVGHPNKISGW